MNLQIFQNMEQPPREVEHSRDICPGIFPLKYTGTLAWLGGTYSGLKIKHLSLQILQSQTQNTLHFSK